MNRKVYNGRFYTRHIIHLDELKKTFVVRLIMRFYGIKTGTRRIMRLNELSLVVRRLGRISQVRLEV